MLQTETENFVLYEDFKNGGIEARDELFEKNLGLVKYVLSKYPNYYEYNNELFCEGMFGLLNAINSYNSSKNVRFSTYATTCVNNAVLTKIEKISRYNKRTVSINNLIDNGEGSLISFEETFCSTEPLLDECYYRKEKLKKVFDFIRKNCTPTVDKIFRLRVMGYDSKEIAEKMKLEQKRVAVIIKINIARMKRNFKKEELEWNEQNYKVTKN